MMVALDDQPADKSIREGLRQSASSLSLERHKGHQLSKCLSGLDVKITSASLH